MLILTPPPHPTECISGYLHRLSAVNGYSMPSWIIEPYRNGYHGDDYRRIRPEVIMRLAGLSEMDAARLCVRPIREGSRATMQLLGTELHVSHVDMKVLRICPLCVRENSRHEAFWHLKLVQWCPIHRTPLLSNCRACGVKLRWNRPGIGVCNCGADLTDQVSEDQCLESVANLMFVLRAALYGDAETHASRPRSLAHLYHLDLYRLMRLYETLGYEVTRPRKLGSTWDSGPRYGADVEVCEALSNWPHGFQEFLRRRYGHELEKDGSRRSFKRTFPWVFWTLGKNMKEHAAQLKFLRDEVMRFGADYWTREQLTRESESTVLSRLDCEWGSVPDAALLMGIDPRTLLRRIKDGLVPFKENTTRGKNRNFKVNLRWASKQKRSAGTGLGVRQAAQVLGISTSLLTALRRHEIYKVKFLTRRRDGYAIEDLQDIKKRLDVVVARHSVDGLVSGIVFDGQRLDRIRPLASCVQALKAMLAQTLRTTHEFS